MNGRELRILVVNTSAEETHSLAQVWQAAGLPVRAREVRTREALLRALQEERPDVVLNWCLFPELDGVSALQLVHQVAEDIPFVIVGERRGQAAQLCLDAGATAFFEKGEAQKVAEFMRSLCSGLQATQSSEVVAKRKVALLIEPLSLRLRIEKMLQKRRDMVLLPLLRGMSNAPATPDLLIVALNELTPFSSVMVSDLPLFLLASENTETQAIEYLRQGALGYALIENLTEKRLDAALYQAFRWLDLEQRYVQEHQNIKKLNDALDVLEQKCKKLETRCSEMELVLSNEIERAEGLRRELAEQNELFVALAKENEERQFWIEALAQREQRFRKMIEHSSDMIMLLDSQAHILYESSVAERALGYSSEELLGHSLFELVHTSDREAMQAEFLQSIHKTGDMPPMRLRMQHKSGEWRYIELVANNLLHDNAICAIIVNLRDITERVQVEKELQRAKEDFEARVIERTRDLIELSRKLQEEIAARKRVEQTLQQSEDYFWTIFHLSPAAILLCSAEDGKILNANTAFENLSGISYEDAIGRTIEQVGLQLSKKELSEALAHKTNSNALTGMETELISQTGEVRSVLAAAQAIELGVQSCWLIILQDVTEHKRAELSLAKSLAEKEILLKEIHHRVKNNLQVVSSLLYLQSLKLTDERAREIFRESQNRIKSMALIHEQLYQTKDFAEINFAEYLHSLVGMLSDSYTVSSSLIEVKTSSENLSVSIHAAVPAGLIVSELVTNSLKYAFPDGVAPSGGEKKITIFAAKNAEKEVCLEVRDNGIGFPVANPIESPKTLGLRLVKMLTEQLHGTVEARTENGAVFRISFRDDSP